MTPYGRPFCLLQHCHRCGDKLIASMRETSSPTSAPLMPYGQPFRQHRHRLCRRDKMIAGTQKTPLPKSAPTVGFFPNTFIVTATEIPSSLTRGRPHRRHQPPQCLMVGLVANTCIVNCRQPTEQRLTVYIIAGASALGLIIGTSTFSLITLYTGPFLRRLPSSQPSWWGNVSISSP